MDPWSAPAATALGDFAVQLVGARSGKRCANIGMTNDLEFCSLFQCYAAEMDDYIGELGLVSFEPKGYDCLIRLISYGFTEKRSAYLCHAIISG